MTAKNAPPTPPPTGVQAGVVVKFEADRGFGFIRPDSARGAVNQDIFVHVRNVEGRRTLHPGQRVRFTVARTSRGLTALNVQAGSVLNIPYLKFLLIGIGSALVLLFGLAFALDRPGSLALWIGMWAVALSMATFGLYGWDKARAGATGTRVPELVLHLLAALGGTPGAFLGMCTFRHKVSDRRFQAIFWLIVAAQVGVLAWWLLSL
ncbi:MAG: Cold shock protein CspA [Chloroflexi bacterium ADurb.Bin325]|nr:MAG: Cold shock protein CspA [Chloroflexi bacterium ADurb.Bin325]